MSDVVVQVGAYPNEVSWELQCDSSDFGGALRGGAPYAAAHGVSHGASCTLSMFDSFGDGWAGNAWSAPGWLVKF